MKPSSKRGLMTILLLATVSGVSPFLMVGQAQIVDYTTCLGTPTNSPAFNMCGNYINCKAPTVCYDTGTMIGNLEMYVKPDTIANIGTCVTAAGSVSCLYCDGSLLCASGSYYIDSKCTLTYVPATTGYFWSSPSKCY